MKIEITLKGIGFFKNYMPDKKGEHKLVFDEGKTLYKLLEDINIDNKISYIVSVNGRITNTSYIPKNGDTIVLMPPIYGG